jgi:hypothetical protein
VDRNPASRIAKGQRQGTANSFTRAGDERYFSV